MLVSTQWLSQCLDQSDLVVLDASLHLPSAGRDPGAEFAGGHIPGARFLDLASLHDPSSSMPGKVPDAPRVRSRLGQLGVGPDCRVVLYDDSDLHTACRAWMLLTIMGMPNMAVLDGGLAKWRAEGRPMAQGGHEGIERVAARALSPDRSRIRSKSQMADNLTLHEEQVVDARDPGRFSGHTVDTVHNLPGGHIPGARNVWFAQLFNDDGTFLPEAELAQRFRAAGIDPEQKIVTTCGSGVTASVVNFALALIGAKNTALYDGSWAEWGSDPGTPKEKAPLERESQI